MYDQKRMIANSDLSDAEKRKQTNVVQNLINQTLDSGYELAFDKSVKPKEFKSFDEKKQEYTVDIFNVITKAKPFKSDKKNCVTVAGSLKEKVQAYVNSFPMSVAPLLTMYTTTF